MTRVPRVPRCGEALRLGRDGRSEFRNVGAAEDDEAGSAELVGEVRRHRPANVTQRPDPERELLAGDHGANVLEQERHSTEQAGWQLAARLEPRLVEPRPNDGVKLRVDLLDPGDRGLNQLRRARLS